MIEIRGMRPEELETVHQILDRAFTKTPKSYFDSQVKNDPYLEPDDTRILLEDGIIRSCVRVYFRDIRCMETKLHMGGIGDVGTDPEVQGRGFAYKLLQEAIDYMRKKGADISFLFTSINPFYQRSGYFTLPMKKMIIDTHNASRDG